MSNNISDAGISRVLQRAAQGVVATPDPSYKPNYSTPSATYAVLNHAVKTNDFELLVSCMSPGFKARMFKGLEGELLRTLGPAMLAEMGVSSLGKQLSATDDVAVFEYTRNGKLVTNDDQRFVKVGVKWLLDN